METRPRNPDDGIATCMLCGELLKGRDKVRYQGWWCHTECTAESIEENVDNFDRTPFIIGSIGGPIGIILALSLFYSSMQLMPALSVWPVAIPFIGMGTGLMLQSIGFHGFYSRYFHPMGIALAILAIISSVIHLVVGMIMFVNASNPAYYDLVTGEFLPLLIPGLWFYLFLAYISLAFLMLIIAVEVSMLEGTIGSGRYNKIIALVFIILIAVAPGTPIGIIV
ncbi:MAG: hypothetical protein ACXAEF_02915, partial [Candidatus Thorarchaeota archaeon]